MPRPRARALLERIVCILWFSSPRSAFLPEFCCDDAKLVLTGLLIFGDDELPFEKVGVEDHEGDCQGAGCVMKCDEGIHVPGQRAEDEREGGRNTMTSYLLHERNIE